MGKKSGDRRGRKKRERETEERNERRHKKRRLKGDRCRPAGGGCRRIKASAERRRPRTGRTEGPPGLAPRSYAGQLQPSPAPHRIPQRELRDRDRDREGAFVGPWPPRSGPGAGGSSGWVRVRSSFLSS